MIDCRNDGLGCTAPFECKLNGFGDYECLNDAVDTGVDTVDASVDSPDVSEITDIGMMGDGGDGNAQGGSAGQDTDQGESDCRDDGIGCRLPSECRLNDSGGYECLDADNDGGVEGGMAGDGEDQYVAAAMAKTQVKVAQLVECTAGAGDTGEGGIAGDGEDLGMRHSQRWRRLR